MVLSLSDHPWRKWGLRAVAGFLVVYMLGAVGIETLVPYLAVLLAVIVDGLRLIMARLGTAGTMKMKGNDRDRERETIH
jgi:hypothetical protein